MSRLVGLVRWWWYVNLEVWRGTAMVLRHAVRPSRTTHPSIVQVPLQACTDIEVVAVAMTVQLTPGTVVVGIAGSAGDEPVSLFVHALDLPDRQAVLDVVGRADRLTLGMLRGHRVDEVGP